MLKQPGLNFSFSGLKTHVRQVYEQSDQSNQTKADIAHAFEQAVVDSLMKKCQRAIKLTGLNHLIIAGGVASNQTLRQRARQLFEPSGIKLFYPRPEFCTDNGAMVAYAGYRYLAQGKKTDLTIDVKARWPLLNTTCESH